MLLLNVDCMSVKCMYTAPYRATTANRMINRSDDDACTLAVRLILSVNLPFSQFHECLCYKMRVDAKAHSRCHRVCTCLGAVVDVKKYTMCVH